MSITIIEANSTTFHYEWAVSNSATTNALRLEVAYFEIGGTTSSGGAVVIPTWTNTTSAVPGYNAIQFNYSSGTVINNGATQTFSYDLDSYLNDVQIRTETRFGLTEDFAFVDLAAGCTLPVELTSLSALRSANNVQLNWETASEVNVSGFEIEIGQQNNFETVAFVSAKGSENSATNYLFDYQLLNSASASVRLKMIDRDGTSSYSSILEIDPDYSNGSLITSEIYPNPTQSEAFINISSSLERSVLVEVYDILGRRKSVVADRTFSASENAELRIDTNAFAPGLYIVRTSTNDATRSQKMIVGS